MDRAYLDEARADRYSDGWSGLVGAVECGGADDPRYSASLEFYRRLGLDIPQGSEEKAFVQMRMESGVSIFWDTVFADKYDPDRAYTRDPGGPPDQQPGTTPTGRWTNLTTASPKG